MIHLNQTRAHINIALWLAAITTIWLSCFVTAAIANTNSPQPIRFIHLGDPQFGYELDGKSANAKRMQAITTAISNTGVDFVVIPGDLVEDRSLAQRWAFEKSIRPIEQPLILVPGNHDIVDAGDIANYRKHFGQDYGLRRFGWLSVITLNSEVMRDQSISPEEHHQQWQWFEATIDRYITTRETTDQLIIVTHRPPFVNAVDEGTTNSNWPPATRQRLLSLAASAGVDIILAGHTHTTVEIPAVEYGLIIYTVGGTARVFDDLGSGYRLFTMQSSGYQQQYRQTDTPAKTAKGFLGYGQWTPRLFDFSIRHWLWTLAFGAMGIFLLRHAYLRSLQRHKPRKLNPSRSLSRACYLCGLWYLFFAINMQLDFDELFAEWIRRALPDALKLMRHQLSPIVIAVIGLSLLIWTSWFCRGIKWKKAYTLLILALPTLVWFLLQIISNHKIMLIWSESIWDWIFLICLALTGIIIFFKSPWQPQR